MKSQERHELETNALAKLLATWGERLAPYSSHILFGIVALVAALAIWRLSASAWSGGESEGWDQIASTMVELRPDLGPLKATGEEFKGDPEGELAKILLADSDLYVASYQFLADKEEAMKRLGAARETYEQLAKEADDPVIRDRAKLGKARVLEIEGNISEAIEAYKAVGGIYKESAADRATLLSEGEADKYGKWLRQAQGTIPRRPAGLGGQLDFSADGLQLPAETPASGPLFGDEPLKEFEALQSQTPDAPRPDRYRDTDTPEGESGLGEPEGGEDAEEGASDLFDAPAPTGGSTDTPTDSEPAPPADDSSEESAASPPAIEESTPAPPQ